MSEIQGLMVVVNPRAGLLNTRTGGRDVAGMLRRALPGAMFAATESEEQGERALREAVQQKIRRVIVAGGDGTMHHAACVLAGTDVELALIPLGSANNIARSLAIPEEPRRAMRLAAEGRAHPMDAGLCGDRLFLEAAGIGFHARVLKLYSRTQTKSLARSIYSVARTALEMQPIEVHLTVDGAPQSHVIAQLTISNLPLYGTNFRPAPRARPDDGLLDVTLIPLSATGSMPVFAAALREGRLHELIGVRSFRCRELGIRTNRPEPLHIDADTSLCTPALIKVSPAAIRIVRPDPPHRAE